MRSSPPIGHLVKQPDLAKTLRAISELGAEAFYQGDIAKCTVPDMQSRKGIVSKSDLKITKVRYREPLVGTYHTRSYHRLLHPPVVRLY